MHNKIDALARNKTWSLTSLTPGKKALGYSVVYKLRCKFDGSIERYKAQLVILRNTQVEEIDYTETFPLYPKRKNS